MAVRTSSKLLYITLSLQSSNRYLIASFRYQILRTAVMLTLKDWIFKKNYRNEKVAPRSQAWACECWLFVSASWSRCNRRTILSRFQSLIFEESEFIYTKKLNASVQKKYGFKEGAAENVDRALRLEVWEAIDKCDKLAREAGVMPLLILISNSIYFTGWCCTVQLYVMTYLVTSGSLLQQSFNSGT